MKKMFFITIGLALFFTSYSQNFNYDIKFHRLDIVVDPAVKYIKGNVTTYFSPVKTSMSTISFDLMNELTVDSIIFHNNQISFTHENNIVTAQLSCNLAPGTLDSISIYYKGVPPDIDGFGAFLTETHYETPIMWTLSEPFGAKTWWPCKIELNDKADSIDLIVTAPLQYSVASNGLISKIDTLPGNLKKTHWKHRYPITAYLIAFAVTNYKSFYDYVNIGDSINLPILEMVYPEDYLSASAETQNVIDVLQFYCDSFMLYPFWKEKYGQAQFNWGGGMEHQTMTFLYNFDHDLMAHELAHQWFGDYITCGSWHDIWLNEGFAVYLEGLTAEQGLAPYTWYDWKNNLINIATSQSDGSVYVDDTTSVSRIFNYRLTYMKGGSILHMLRWIIGDEAFFKGLRNYLHDPNLAFGYAKLEDFKKHMEIDADTTLTEFFNDWYYGEGFPYYEITWKQNIDFSISININQTNSIYGVPFFDMILPIELVFEDGNSQIVRLNNNTNNQTFNIKSDTYVSNVIFDPEQWILTKNALVSKKIDSTKLSVKIGPNPSNEILNLIFPNITFVKSVIIYDTNGQLINKIKIEHKKTEMNISTKNLERGTYIIKIETQNETISEKFIKL